ncbi:hypothetical protein BDK51DRAFT_36705 [Blyttiomyces helicus]|uniref:Uncharacterized protein n=1 Tax=Blyttiomyces helicus TaxID=388810 RepID=A0A4V1IR75_9FUNG|nr:hypothetical protein BDK51DRAFT_36705 [Blyttiomyces helicus]|eukprot:RKO89077.1 hypothetical protein BDK51DRAFT_36705 [Blyttiomyces helicus]
MPSSSSQQQVENQRPGLSLKQGSGWTEGSAAGWERGAGAKKETVKAKKTTLKMRVSNHRRGPGRGPSQWLVTLGRFDVEVSALEVSWTVMGRKIRQRNASGSLSDDACSWAIGNWDLTLPSSPTVQLSNLDDYDGTGLVRLSDKAPAYKEGPSFSPSTIIAPLSFSFPTPFPQIPKMFAPSYSSFDSFSPIAAYSLGQVGDSLPFNAQSIAP